MVTLSCASFAVFSSFAWARPLSTTRRLYLLRPLIISLHVGRKFLFIAISRIANTIGDSQSTRSRRALWYRNDPRRCDGLFATIDNGDELDLTDAAAACTEALLIPDNAHYAEV
jgi:hypothetical protein